ncbi:unnamed protein product [Cuscuta campestris]|uniref:Putative plant transposon protein domain-containing protein n=1 Tax=Cuscuta campestris TaxID=132261 RepID=A0A484KKR0_9ASTE|nr:unnamed protein product [Cuscuta campestris]
MSQGIWLSHVPRRDVDQKRFIICLKSPFAQRRSRTNEKLKATSKDSYTFDDVQEAFNELYDEYVNASKINKDLKKQLTSMEKEVDKLSKGGQRKRSRTGKNVASSTIDAQVPRQVVPLVQRPRRGYEAGLQGVTIPREARVILQEGNFLDLLYIKKNDYQPFLVRAFYLNLKKDEDGSLISNVNGVEIYLNEENIQILIGLRRDGQDLGLYVREEGAQFNETVLLAEVGIRNFIPTPQQRRPTIASMSPVFRFIFYVLTRILRPRKFNHTTLSQEDTKTLHAIIHNTNINWFKFVMTHMFSATSDDRPLPYALLVMAILEEYNIKTDVGPKIKGTKHWEINESSFHWAPTKLRFDSLVHAANQGPPLRPTLFLPSKWQP